MDLLAYATQCEQAAQAMEREAGRIAVGIAQIGLSLTVLSIQRDGLPGKPRYSTKLIPTFYFRGKELNQAGRTYIKKQKLGTWGGFRQAQGLPSAVVNITYSGRTLRSLQPVLVSSGAGKASAKLVSSTDENQRILGYLVEKYGDFLEPQPAVVGEARLYATKEVTAILQRYITL